MLATHAQPTRPPVRPHFQTETLRALAVSKPLLLPSPDRLFPGHVISTGPGSAQRLVVISTSMHPSGRSVRVVRRPLMGGTDSVTSYNLGRRVKVCAFGAHDQFTPEQIPSVPALVLPKDPQDGDRIWSQSAQSSGSMAALAYVRRSGGWERAGRYPRSDRAVEKAVSDPQALASEWYVYQRAGSRAHLYVDGQAYPAKAVADLVPGDVLPAPGGALSTLTELITGIPCQEDKARLVVTADEMCAYPWGHIYTGVVRGCVYTEWRALDAMLPVLPYDGDYIPAAEVRPDEEYLDRYGRHHTGAEILQGDWHAAGPAPLLPLRRDRRPVAAEGREEDVWIG